MTFTRPQLWWDRDERGHRAELAQSIYDLADETIDSSPGQGLVHSASVTLVPNAITTVVTDTRIQSGMRAWLFPASASSSDEQMYISPADIIDGQITINHASTGETDKLVFVFWV